MRWNRRVHVPGRQHQTRLDRRSNRRRWLRHKILKATDLTRSLLNNNWFIALVGGIIATGLYALCAYAYTQLL